MTKKLGLNNIENDARAMRVLTSYSPTPIGTTDHGGLLGLGDDDHSQYVHLTSARTITAQHSFSPGSAQPPFVLGANAQSQLVTGLRADQLSKTVTAGNGLTGGGTLTGSITLNLDTPGTLSVASANTATGNHTHAITSSSNPGVAASLLATDASGNLILQNATLAGITGLTLSGAGADLVFSGSGTHDISASSGTMRLGALTLTGAITGNAQTITGLAQLTVDNLRLDGNTLDSTSGNLILSGTDDIVFDPTGNDILPNTNYDLNMGAINKKYLTLHAAELWVETLVAQDTIATIGGRILVGPTTELIADLASGATTMDVKHNQMSNGDRTLMQANLKFEYMAITSDPTAIAGGYRYNVTRNLDGTGANDWYAGDAVVNTGTTGSGFIDLYSLESVNGRTFDHLYQDDGGVFSANYATQSNFAYWPAIAVANDAFYWGLEGATWKNAFLNITTAGVFTATVTWEYWNGSAWTSFTPTDIPSFTSAGQKTLSLGTLSGWATTSVNGATAYWVRARLSAVISWTTPPQQGGKRVIREKSQWGPTVVGWVRNSSAFNDITESWAIGNLNGLYGYGVDTYGVGLGKFGISAENYITVDPTNGVRFFSGSNVRAQLTATTWTLGLTTADHVSITTSGVQMKDSSVVKIDAQTDGDFFIGTDISAAGTTYLSIFSGAQTYNSESMGAGDMLIGDNSASKANILWDKSEGRLKFRGGTSTRFYVDTGGELVFDEGGNYLYFYDGTYPGASFLTTFSASTRSIFILGNPKQAIGENANTYVGSNKTAATAGAEFTGMLAHLDYDTAGNDYVLMNVGGTDVLYLTQPGGVFIGDTANTGMTVGLTINQGVNDDEILAFKSSDVAHGVTTITETDTFGYFQKVSAGTGGLRLVGLREVAASQAVAMQIRGIGGSSDTARSTAALGAVLIDGLVGSGTSVASLAANGNLLVVRDNVSARFLVDVEGDIHMDATSNINAWDEFDDVALLAGVREAMNPGLRLAEFVEEARPVLERTGVVRYNPDGHHFISLKKLHALEIDAMRQLYQGIRELKIGNRELRSENRKARSENRKLEERVEQLEALFSAKA